jgi:hypothetical protein
MAKLFDQSVCESFTDFSQPLTVVLKQEADAIERTRKYFRSINKGELVGEVLSWPRGDGYAQYMVVKQRPLTLAHMTVGDAWQVEHALIKGIDLGDVKQMVELTEKRKAIFGGL